MIVQPPSISYKAFPSWEVHFVRVYDDGTLSGVDMSAGVSYNAAVDLDFNINTNPLIRTLDADIDHSQAASGIISLGLNAGTEGFLSAVNGRNSVQGWFELRGYDTTDRCIYDYRIKCNCLGAIDPNSGDPIPVASGGITQADVLALLRASLEYQFSSDGDTWHQTQDPTDKYYRTRYPQGEWGEAIEIQNGQDAPALQIKYSDDNSSWSSYGPTPTSSSFYMAQSVDGGSSWISGILFHGQDGTNGANGVGFRTVGAYNDATTYKPYTASGYYEVVAYDGSTYAYINDTASSGHTPPTATLIDSYWQCIAKKGANGSVDNVDASDVNGLTEYISGVVSGEYATKTEVENSISEISGAVDAELLNYYTTSQTYSISQVNDNFLGKNDAANTYATKSTLTSVSGTLQGEIDYLSGQISGGGGDLSNYTPLSTTQAISSYLQTEIDNIPGGGETSGALTGVTLNGEPQTISANVANIMALPIATTMLTPDEATQQFTLYLGDSITSGDNYVGALRSYDVVSEYDVYYPYLDMRINGSSNTGTNRVWSGYPAYPSIIHTQLAYDNGWKLSSYYEAQGEPDSAWHEVGSLSNPDVSGQPWGRYYLSGNTGLNPIPSGRYWDFKPQADISKAKQIWGCNIVTKCHLYELDEAWDDICIFVTIPSFVGSPTYLFKKKDGVTEWYEFNSGNGNIDEEGWSVKPNYSSAWRWELFIGDTYILQEATQDYTKMPWDYSGHLWRDTTLGDDIYPIIKRVFIGKWNDLGSMLH